MCSIFLRYNLHVLTTLLLNELFNSNMCLIIFLGTLYSSTIKQSTTLKLKAFLEFDIKQYLYKTYMNLVMAGHASLMVKGKLLFLSVQIWCKQNSFLATAQNHYFRFAIAILNEIWEISRKKITTMDCSLQYQWSFVTHIFRNT